MPFERICGSADQNVQTDDAGHTCCLHLHESHVVGCCDAEHQVR
jgi:hypothetical protein